MTSAEEALKALATEVLWQLDLRHLIATPGITISPTEKSCKVCALGALIYTHYVLAEPNIDRTELGGMFSWDMLRFLERKHSINQREMRRVELAFEQGGGFFRSESEEDYAAILFGRRIENKTKRMRAIMQNIIDNNGTFQP